MESLPPASKESTALTITSSSSEKAGPIIAFGALRRKIDMLGDAR